MENDPSGSPSLSGLRTGTSHAFVRSETIAELHSDFNQTGQVDFSEAQRAARTQRPGSILLPIFYLDLVCDEENFHAEDLTPVCIRPSNRQDALPDAPLELACVQSADRNRGAVHSQEGEHLYGRYAGNAPESLMGPDADRVSIRGADTPDGEDFLMCATTLAGDPRRPGPINSSPPQSAENAPANLTPGEIWLRLGRQQEEEPSPKRRRTEAPTADDVALFQIAPLLLQSNLAPARRLYVVNGMTDDEGTTNNHNFVYDVMEACWAAFGPDRPFARDSDRLFSGSDPEASAENDVVAPGECRLSDDKMYLIDGRKYKEEDSVSPDFWIQDPMATGYCSAPGKRAVNVVLHCKRDGPLSNFVTGELENKDERVFAFNGLFDSKLEQDGTDYGGNIAVSPPVGKETESENTRKAGPPVKRHPPAPHGKIILGDCYNENRDGNGVVHDETRTFLQAQGMQPIIPIDTSWLSVGHVDEIMTFVPGTDGPRLAMARPDVMDTLLDRTRQYSVEGGRTHFHRGRFSTHSMSSNLIGGYDETSIEDLCTNERRQDNRDIRTQFLDPIEHRICHCTGLDRKKDVLPLPVYFQVARPHGSWGNKQAKARTPNVVNMQVLQKDRTAHLIVARPSGPRLPRDKAETVVRSVLEDTGQEGTEVCLPQDHQDGQPGFPFWAWPDLHPDTLALFFTRKKTDEQGNEVFLTAEERRQLIDVINAETDFNDLPRDLQKAVDNTQAAILQANCPPEEEKAEGEEEEEAGINRVRNMDEEGEFESWYRVFIPEDTVDIIEAYTQSVLKRIGCQVHFVDAWHYHTLGGGVHCGTNVLHEAPISEEGPANAERSPWWQHYASLADADTTYDPKHTAPNPSSQPTDP